MIKDDILYGNLLGLMRTGKWSMNLSEAVAFIQIVQELERRLKPPTPTEGLKSPISASVKRGKK